MDKIKISSLEEETYVVVDGYGTVITVKDVLNNLEFYKKEVLHTTMPYYASFNARDIIENAIENEASNGMYEDWEESIRLDIKDEDIEDLQRIFDRLLARDSSANTSYVEDKLIEIDID